ncbi:dynein axonemal assembly factor 6 [Diorhabda sublineata]|uniref:dynein axonemal assembly factor 6 n=1 Tax=Diorhabda sublineata TaxID=1163346 RepID=UPI0024E1542C|nr:dynein axonemal assembly factor 6 [Diorhabda sublineata]
MAFEFNEIQKLAELFNPNRDNSDSENEIEDCVESKPCPNTRDDSFNEEKKKVNPYSKIERKEKLLEQDEIQILDESCEENKIKTDWKKTPAWDVAYKQQVTASDVFLQMGFKNPTTSSCEDMIVTISLPGDSHYNIDLKIQKENLILVSPTYFLDLRLPHPVDPQKGNAKWDNDTEKLIVTLRMDRELDLVNF